MVVRLLAADGSALRVSSRGRPRKNSSADSPAPALKGSSKYRGVSWNSNCNKWRAQVSCLPAMSMSVMTSCNEIPASCHHVSREWAIAGSAALYIVTRLCTKRVHQSPHGD